MRSSKGSLLGFALLSMLVCAAGPLLAQPLAKTTGEVHAAVSHGKVRVLVSLIDPAPAKAAMAERSQRIREQRTQLIDGLDAKHFELRRDFASIPAFAAEIDATALDALLADPQVRRVDLDAGGSGAMLQSRPLAFVDSVHDSGVRGAGQTIAVIDSGIATGHQDFVGRVVAQQCFCSNSSGSGGCCPNGNSRQSGAGSALDDHGHGTNVSGIAAGGGAIAFPGSASGANIVSIKVLDRNNRFCCTSDVLAALDWIAVNHPEAKIINASLGTSQLLSGNCDSANSGTQAGAAALAVLAQNDSLLFSSAGNQGNSNAMSMPACLSAAIGVGALWDFAATSATAIGCTDSPTQPGQATCFSNSSAGTDIYAPGAFVTSSGIGGGLSNFAGTSQATPLTAGCAASLRSAVPTANSAQIRAALLATPLRVTDAKNGREFPRLHCADALAKLRSATEANYSAIYYAPANAGYGISVTHQANTLAVAWYSYDAAGRPTWFTAAAVLDTDAVYRGDFFRTTGTPLAQIANMSPTQTTVTAGRVELRFDASGNLSFGFQVAGEAGQQRQLEVLRLASTPLSCRFTAASRATATNFSDLWWNPIESGWGLTLLHQGSQIFLAWYTYANDQQPQWLTSVLVRQPNGQFRGALNRALTGTPFSTPPVGAVTSFPLPEVGSVSLNFSDGQTGVFEYNVDGVTQTKPIQRFVFGARVQVCEG